MITNATVDSTSTEDGMRMIKVDQFGAKEPYECAPFGFDSNPVKDMTAVYADTSENGEPVIIGYINENQLSDIGELRLYNSNKSYIWLKNDDTIELNGNSRTIVAFIDLKTAGTTPHAPQVGAVTTIPPAPFSSDTAKA